MKLIGNLNSVCTESMAARPAFPANCPTITASAVVYSCWIRLPRMMGRTNAASALEMLSFVKSNCFFVIIPSSSPSVIPQKIAAVGRDHQALPAAATAFTQRCGASASAPRIIFCSSSDLYLRRSLSLPSQVAPMTGFHRRDRDLDTYSTVSCGDSHPIPFSASQPSAGRKDTENPYFMSRIAKPGRFVKRRQQLSRTEIFSI